MTKRAQYVRKDPLPVTRRKGEPKEDWARRVMRAWSDMGEPRLWGCPAEQVQLARKYLGLDGAYGEGVK